MSHTLDPRLANDTLHIATINSVSVLLHKDKRFPWIILVPNIESISELHNLDFDMQIICLKISNLISRVLTELYSPDKINIASLGNIVKQLHIHHVARFAYDDAWPGPIWGAGDPDFYTNDECEQQAVQVNRVIDSINQGELHVNYHY